jgi:GxxExxY protein
MGQFEDLPETQTVAKATVGLAMKVHRTLGSGFLETVYANALAIELERAGIVFQRESRIAVTYEGVVIGDYIADFILQNSMVVELKAVENLTTAHSLQLVNYLAATRFDLGLLLNFGSKSLEFKTKTSFYNTQPLSPRTVKEDVPEFGNSVNSV